MDKTDRFSSKAHFLAWDKEYSHLQWGGPNSIGHLKTHVPEGSRVLDAGSGDGRYLKELAKPYIAVGADVSFTALRNSRAQLAKSGKMAEHAVASIHALPFRSGSFDAVLCYGVLQHLFQNEREAAVREFKRVLGPGGLVFFEAFGSEDMRYGGEPAKPAAGPAETNTFLRQSGIIYHYFTEEELLSLFEGFEVLELQSLKREKKFRGETYLRHHIRGIFRVP